MIPGGASAKSLQRWILGGCIRKKKAGGPRKTNFVGIEQLLLALIRLAYPRATADQIRTWFAMNSPRRAITRLCDRVTVTRAEQALGLTRKLGSTTAFQAFTPYNMMRRRLFWSRPWPLSRLGIPRADLVDIVEAGAFTKQVANQKRGKAPKNVRVRAPGVYSKSGH